MGYLPDGERFMVCGSNGGSDHAPAWALNLRSHPDATVEVGARTVSVTVTEVTGGDYEDTWARYVAAYRASPGTGRKPDGICRSSSWSPARQPKPQIYPPP